MHTSIIRILLINNYLEHCYKSIALVCCKASLLEIDKERRPQVQIYDKWNNCNFAIVKLPFVCDKIDP